MARFVSLLFAGLAVSAIYGLTAVGFLLLYKATGLINFAQGALISLGAYLAVWAHLDLDLPLLLAYGTAVVIAFVLGCVMEAVAYRPLERRSIHVVVIATLGLAVIIESLLAIWQGSTPRKLDSPVEGDTVTIFGAAISAQRLLIIVVSGVALAGLALLFQRTNLGRRLRAIATDRDAAKTTGINVRRLTILTFGLSAAIAAVTGILLAPLTAVTIDLGFPAMLGAFGAAIIGGFGSIRGTLYGALILGLSEHLVGGYVLVSYRSMFPYVLLILVIAIRPKGLFGDRLEQARF